LTAINVDPDAGCTGVYTAEQGVWVAIERGSARQMTQTVGAERVPSPLAAGDGWTVDLDVSDPAAAHVVVTDDAGAVVSDQTVPGWVPLQEGEQRDVTVIVDPVTNTSTITVDTGSGDDALLFLPGELLAAGPLRSTADSQSPLCQKLLDRL
jgi:hypothetical protein